ncbi:MAG: selenium cofactor biosynthesis protein YqeC [Acidobacteriota bacterium]
MDTKSEAFVPFSKLFNFKLNSLVNFVGGGGKTILIHQLMDEYVHQGHVLYTTTMRIHPPQPDGKMAVLSSDNLTVLKSLVVQALGGCTNRNFKIVATRQFMEPDLLNGVPPDFLSNVDRALCTIFLNEADGSARFSLKLPRQREPVLMEEAQYLVPVIGLDCLDRASGPDTIFRFDALSSEFSIQTGQTITPELAADILMHPKGVCRDWKEGMTIVPFINKVDTQEQDSKAKLLASHILRNRVFPVSRVVLGSVRFMRSFYVSQG